MRTKIFALFNAILLLIAGISPLYAQESSGGGTSVTTEVERSTETATRSTETVVPWMDSNTTLLIVIAALAFLILIVALVRGSSRRDVSKTVIHDRRP